jgi:hypothetical protein
VIVFPIVLFALYAAMHASSTVKGLRIKEDTVESANATTRLVLIVVATLVLLSAMNGGL